jgi:hypothetical protein
VRVDNGIATDHYNLTTCIFDHYNTGAPYNARAHHHDCPSHRSGRAGGLPR